MTDGAVTKQYAVLLDVVEFSHKKSIVHETPIRN